MFKLWAYRHTQDHKWKIKRYFDDRDLQDAYESPFCEVVIGPSTGGTYNEALFDLFRNQPGVDIVQLLQETVGKEI